MLKAVPIGKRIIDLFREHSSHLSVIRRMQHLERFAGRNVAEKSIDISLRCVVKRLVKELHVFAEHLVNVNEIAQRNRHLLSFWDAAKAKLNALLSGAVSAGHDFVG
jgi:hypothetical protein